jgi:hypothetical protein
MNKRQVERYMWISKALGSYGLSDVEVQQLIRCERTLGRWDELECGDGNDYGSWAIERDEDTGKPFMVHHHYRHGNGKDYTTRTPIADREAGAIKRAKAIAERHGLTIYHQGDPRGCTLYVIRPGDVPEGAKVESCYNRGIALCID